MKYPDHCANVIDVTKPPYNADNTGKSDCTKILIQILDDILKGYPEEIAKTREKLYRMSDALTENAYIGRETGRVLNGELNVSFPEFIPDGKIIYFPKGIYLVSDTVTYSLKNLNTLQQPGYVCELCRNIHFLGEDKDSTVIRLSDNAKGFNDKKAVLCFNGAAKFGVDKETTNCAMQNTVKDITIDCGRGNDQAVGILYSSSNLGRIENVNVKTQSGYCGIYFDVGSEGVFRNIKISGFDYGIETLYTSPVILENCDLSSNKAAAIKSDFGGMVINRVKTGDIPMFELKENSNGRFLVSGSRLGRDDTQNNHIYYIKEDNYIDLPKAFESDNANDYAYVDDFGAIGDGKTDCTKAIQKAMNSGKPIILFGNGMYHIEKKIKIPSTVRVVDFMYSNLSSGIQLITGEIDAAFDICQESENTLFIRNLLGHEQYYGYFRSFKHSAKRDVVISDICTIFTSLYFNTVGGSNVYFDNCQTTTGTYSQNNFTPWNGCLPVFSKVIPVELHSQNAFANNLNIERGDIELLCDNSDLLINGYKTEGPGTAVKCINGGRAKINLINNGLWNNGEETLSLYEVEDSKLEITGVFPFLFTQDKRYCNAFNINGKKINLYDCSEYVSDSWRLINHFNTEEQSKPPVNWWFALPL